MLRPLCAVLIAALPMNSPAASPDFAAEWRSWHAQRLANLQKPRGWLALVGIHWLSDGENRIEGLPGVFTLKGGKVALAAAPADGYSLDGKPLTAQTLASDAAKAPDILQLGASRAVAVIERGPKIALRVWDADSPAKKAFTGVDAFAPDPRWRIVARWEPYPTPRPVEIPTVVGIPSKGVVPGRAHFKVDGKDLTLEPTAEDDELFFVFKDSTSKKETYGAGRFLDAAAPKDGSVVLDFNRAVNPPCAFTVYATCPLPLPENLLPVRIEAGEKRPAGH